MEPCHIELMKAGSANCFLIHRNGEAVLVDTGKTAYRDRILEACRNFDMRAIALTHGHYDHVQNAAFLSNELNVPIV
ncbi:MAG: MBL fold metallo-hydrolase [Slackia sp.]